MPETADADILITAYDWVPPFAQGLVRDLRPRWAMEEIGLDYRVEYLRQGAQKEPENRARQPFGQVPVYQCGDLTLFESGAIVLHIAGKGEGLLPVDDNARGRATSWLIAALNSVEPPIIDYANARFFERGQGDGKAERLALVEKRIDAALAALSVALGERQWLEDQFTVGDLMMVTVLRELRGTSLLTGYPGLAAYVARGEARPAFQTALADQMAGFTGDPPPQLVKWLKTMEESD